MLNSYPNGSDNGPAGTPVWVDLFDPSEDERRRTAILLGHELPTRKQVGSLALSSRIRASEELLCITVPGFVRAEGGKGALTPLGIVLTPSLLVTLRYADSAAFDRLARDIARDMAPGSSIDAFVKLFETIVETTAERMQVLSGDMSQLSREVFSDSRSHSLMLRSVLFQVGRIERELTQLRSAMLGVQRGLAHLCEGAPAWFGKPQVALLHVAMGDLHALAEFDQQMDDKLQFVLDATLGFINNDQNDTIRVLTIASVVTIPPMILAGIWGMNFRSIPEYGWAHGYAFAWAMIVLSMALPLAWFKWKRWF